MSNMDQRRLELRIMFIKKQIAEMNHEKSTLTEVAEIRRVEDAILKQQGGIDELKQWGREIDLDPGYGRMIVCGDGIRRPKLPVFESREQRAASLDNRAGTPSGLSEPDVRRAREWRSSKDGEVSIRNMDGRSPYIDEEERGDPRGTL